MLEDEKLQSHELYYKSFNNFATVQIWPTLIILLLLITSSLFLKRPKYVKTQGSYTIEHVYKTKDGEKPRVLANLKINSKKITTHIHQKIKLSNNSNSSLISGTIVEQYRQDNANYYSIRLNVSGTNGNLYHINNTHKSTVYLESGKVTYWKFLTQNFLKNN